MNAPALIASDPGYGDEPTAVEANGLVRRFGAVTALDGLSLRVSRGELYGVVGPDGAGKTTAVRAIAGLVRLDSGQVRVHGFEPSAAEVRDKLGLVPQQHSLYGDLSVSENLAFYADLHGLARQHRKKRIDRLLGIMRLAAFVDRRAEALSGGMYKKLAVACALLHQPEVLLLDEPTNGIDPVSRRELWALLHEFVSDGMTVLLSTPNMDEAERCHRVGLLHHGRLILEGEPRALIAGFEESVFEVVGGDRDALGDRLAGDADVYSASPAGSRLRIVASTRAGDRLRAMVRSGGAELIRVEPSFEDLYLARLRKEER
jgi:ABC-2 type transport system ATP-binding protein